MVQVFTNVLKDVMLNIHISILVNTNVEIHVHTLKNWFKLIFQVLTINVCNKQIAIVITSENLFKKEFITVLVNVQLTRSTVQLIQSNIQIQQIIRDTAVLIVR